MVQTVELENCGLCGCAGLETVAELPRFPLTGIFIERQDEAIARGFDQALNMCGGCGHLQLARVLPPPVLYGEGYAHRSSASHLSAAASDFFVGYVAELTPGRMFERILEIGCNDLVLLGKLANKGRQIFGIDPIWTGKTPERPENATVIGGFVEDIDIEQSLGGRPDLIVSTHNLEHIIDPLGLLKRLLGLLADDGMIVIEVPDSDCLVNNRRFDQVFHQHVHYLTLATFLKLIEAAGGRYLGHRYNYANWGGSFSVAFTRDGDRPPMRPPTRPLIRHMAIDEVKAGYAAFGEQMARFRDLVGRAQRPLVGYGGGQMTPSLAWHLGGGLEFLDCIYDDDPARDGLYYPYIAPQIRTPAKDLSLHDHGVVITALDGVRAIGNRLRGLKPRFIYLPTSVY